MEPDSAFRSISRASPLPDSDRIMLHATASAPPSTPYSDVILDVEIERGLLHFVLANIGTAPAHAVRVKLGRVVRDLAGERVNDNPLFTSLEFLAPGRRIRLLVDALSDYVARRQPMKLTATLQWTDDAGRARRRVIAHNLTAWTRLREMQ